MVSNIAPPPTFLPIFHRPTSTMLSRPFFHLRQRNKRQERLLHSLFFSLFSHFTLFLLILTLYFLSSSSSCFLSGINIPTTGLNTFTVYLLLAIRLDILTCTSLTLGRIKDLFIKLYLFFFTTHQLSSPRERLSEIYYDRNIGSYHAEESHLLVLSWKFNFQIWKIKLISIRRWRILSK